MSIETKALIFRIVCIIVFFLFPGAAFSKETLSAKEQSSSVRNLTLPTKSVGMISTIRLVQDPISMVDLTAVSPASGHVKVNVQPDQLVLLEPNNYLLNSPEQFDVLPKTGIDGVKISVISMEDDAVSRSDKLLAHLKSMPHLKIICVDRSDATDKGICSLDKMPELIVLSVPMSNVSGSFLKNPQNFPSLRDYTCFNCQIEPKYFSNLSKLPALQYLDVHHCELDLSACKSIGQCTNLQVLRASENRAVDDQCLACFVGLKKLKRLEVAQTSITIAGLRKLQPLASHLKYLAVSERAFSKADMQEIHKLFPSADVDIVSRGKTVDRSTQDMYAPLH